MNRNQIRKFIKAVCNIGKRICIVFLIVSSILVLTTQTYKSMFLSLIWFASLFLFSYAFNVICESEKELKDEGDDSNVKQK